MSNVCYGAMEGDGQCIVAQLNLTAAVARNKEVLDVEAETGRISPRILAHSLTRE